MLKKLVVSIVSGVLMLVCAVVASAEQSSVTLKEVVVTATKTEKDPGDVTQSVTVITAADIQRSGATTVSEVLEKTVGVAVTDYGPVGALNTMRIRGADYSRVLVLLDGMRLNSPRDLGFDLSALPVTTDDIERIEIVRGPASALYGSEAVGGVVNIITKKPVGKEAKIGGSVGTHGYDTMTLGFGNKSASSYYRIDGTRLTYDGYRPNSDDEQWTYGGKLGFDLSSSASLEFTSNYTNKQNGVPGQKQSPSIDARQNDRMLVTGAGLKINPKNGYLFSMHANRTDETLQYHSLFWNDINKSRNDTVETQLSMLAGTWNTMTLGYEIRRDHLDSTSTGVHSMNVNAYYAQDELSLGDSLILVAGARHDDQSVYGSRMSPKASARYLFKSTNTIVRASYGESFRGPTPNDLYSPLFSCPYCAIDPITGLYNNTLETVGSQNLKPETSKEYEVGMEQPIGTAGKMKLTCFNRSVDNMIIWLKTYPTPTVEHWQPENIGKAEVKGYEAEVSFMLSSAVKMDLNYAYTNPVDQTTGNKIPFIPREQWKGSLSLGVSDRTNLYLEGRAIENYVDPVAPRWQYSVMDVKIVERMGRPGSEIFLSLLNVFDRKYEAVRDYPMPPREIRGGISYPF